MRARDHTHNHAVVSGSTRSGLAELFASEHDSMYRLAYAMLGSDRDAEEVVQDAFVGVARRWDEVDNPGGYLRVSVVNGARKRMRGKVRRARAQATLDVEASEDPPAEQEYLLDVVDALPERQRVAVVLTYYSGLDAVDAGELMGCRPATVRSLVRHGLDRLREVVDR